MKNFNHNDYLKSMVDYLICNRVLVTINLDLNGINITKKGILKYGIHDNYLLEVHNEGDYIKFIPISKDIVFSEIQYFVTLSMPIKIGDHVKFTADADIILNYFQDFNVCAVNGDYFKDVVFTISNFINKNNGADISMILRADGYGNPGKYGNGGIIVYGEYKRYITKEEELT